MKEYEISATREHVVIKALCDNKQTANDTFSLFRANKENSIRARVFEHGKVQSEKYYGEDPDWACMDMEWDDTYRRINDAKQKWIVSKVELTFKQEEDVGRFTSREAAVNWITFEAPRDADYGLKYVYVIDHISSEF